MGIGKFRNEPCHCGSGMKFKYCCLLAHRDAQSRLVTGVAKKEAAKEQVYWKKRYDLVTSEGDQSGE